jgi:ubiquinone biosynthesis protein UbiJ
MIPALNEVLSSAVVSRATLLINHVLSSEPVACARLRPHAGRCLRVQPVDWPGLLPAWPTLRFAITPAGLLEWQPAATDPASPAVVADLEITLQADNPAALLVEGLMGRRPAVSVSGDAALAADVSWVIDNLRWDVRDDLARTFGELPARELSRSASAVATGVRDVVQGLVQRVRSGRDGGASEGGFGSSGAQTPSPAQRPAR